MCHCHVHEVSVIHMNAAIKPAVGGCVRKSHCEEVSHQWCAVAGKISLGHVSHSAQGWISLTCCSLWSSEWTEDQGVLQWSCFIACGHVWPWRIHGSPDSKSTRRVSGVEVWTLGWWCHVKWQNIKFGILIVLLVLNVSNIKLTPGFGPLNSIF